MSEPRLLRGWDAFAEYLQVRKSRLLRERHDLRLKGVVFTRKIRKPNGCNQCYVFAWTDKLRQWEMDNAAKAYAEKLYKDSVQNRASDKNIEPVENQQNTG